LSLELFFGFDNIIMIIMKGNYFSFFLEFQKKKKEKKKWLLNTTNKWMI